MLDYYKDKQPTAYNIMINEINHHLLSHAYLIDENNNLEAFSIVKSFVKEILCSYLDDNEKKRQLIKRIGDDNYQELKIIEPDGMFLSVFASFARPNFSIRLAVHFLGSH